MDYAIDSYFWNNDYNNRRICAKLYVFFKFIGVIFYTISLQTCYNPDFFIGMIVAMFLSTMNSARYEYAHFKRYGTIFSSENEFEEWKEKLYPRSRIIFSIVELVIKIVYFIKIFPPDIKKGLNGLANNSISSLAMSNQIMHFISFLIKYFLLHSNLYQLLNYSFYT